MNFTKQYIKEADCKEIQGLKKEMIDGDWLINRDFYDKPMTWEGYIKPTLLDWDRIIWIPTGDQLDDEIERICKEKYEWYNWIYHVESGLDSSETKMRYYAFIVDNQERPICGDTCIIVYNPLIAKILLLKQLLKEQ